MRLTFILLVSLSFASITSCNNSSEYEEVGISGESNGGASIKGVESPLGVQFSKSDANSIQALVEQATAELPSGDELAIWDKIFQIGDLIGNSKLEDRYYRSRISNILLARYDQLSEASRRKTQRWFANHPEFYDSDLEAAAITGLADLVQSNMAKLSDSELRIMGFFEIPGSQQLINQTLSQRFDPSGSTVSYRIVAGGEL